MEYYDVITKINSFNVLDFTMDDFNSLNHLIKEIKKIYQQDISREKLDAKVHYDAVMDHLYTVVFSILKKKSHFENEVINKIMCLLDYTSDILDVLILDGNVFIKIVNVKNNDISFVPLDSFFDITSYKFSKNTENNNFKYFLIKSFNNSFGHWFNDKLEKNKLLSLNNGIITYNLRDINIFIDNDLKSIVYNNANNMLQTTKVIFRLENDLYSFDMKMQDEYLMFSYNNYPINKLSNVLVANEIVKKI